MLTQTIRSFAFAAIAFAVPVAAQAEEARTFTRNGVTYQYTTTQRNGAEILTGTADGVPFRFVVRGNQVTGYNDRTPVDFTVPARKPARSDIAAR